MDCELCAEGDRRLAVSHEVLKYQREGGTLYVSGQLRVTVKVGQIYNKCGVILRYSTDGWNSWREAEGARSRRFNEEENEQFIICTESTIPPGTLVEYAVCCKGAGMEMWDNNQGRNYQVRF